MIYEPEFADQARAMCRLGATDEELAEHFEVCVRTIYRWRNTHEAFAEAVVVGKEHADARVERALYSRVVGCTVERTRVFKHAGEDPVYATYTVYLPPDPVAARQWLRVRQPEKWGIRDEQEEESPSRRALMEFVRLSEARDAEERRSDSTPPLQPEPPSPPPLPSPEAPAQDPDPGPDLGIRPDDDPATEPCLCPDEDPASNAGPAIPPAPVSPDPKPKPKPPQPPFPLPQPPAAAPKPLFAPLAPFVRGGYR
jgi:hypothetical protein